MINYPYPYAFVLTCWPGIMLVSMYVGLTICDANHSCKHVISVHMSSATDLYEDI